MMLEADIRIRLTDFFVHISDLTEKLSAMKKT